MKTININEVNFEVIRPRKNKLSLEDVEMELERTRGVYLIDAYASPSSAKWFVWDKWMRWYCNNDDGMIYKWGITAHNSFSFTIGGIYYDHETGNYYKLSITPSRNIATYIEG